MRAVPPSPDSRPVTEGRTAPNVAVLDGVLKRVTFYNPETCWLSLTPPGREAFDAHVAALQHVVAKAGATLTPTTLGQS